MTPSKGIWRHEDCALLLIDYQREMFDQIRSKRPPKWST
jgi:hypothetical protein